MKQLSKIFVLLILAISSLFAQNNIYKAYKLHISDIQVKGKGTVVHILKDDNYGHRHQKFILKLKNNQTILIAHNIDLSKKITSLKKNDTIEFYGEYEWSKKGGVVHWTHKDPKHRHIDGWLKHKGKKYQ